MSNVGSLDWNARHAARGLDPRPPSALLRAFDDDLPRVGRALDVAGGTGRNAFWLSRRGLSVTLADASEVALGLAGDAAAERGLAVVPLLADLEAGPLPSGPWDLIVCVDFLWRPLYPLFPEAMAPGGWLAVAHPTEINQRRHATPGPRHLLRPGELPDLVPGLEVVFFDEDWREDGRHEAWLIARRRVESPAVPG
jgi:SAM-dependent methyltransferase